MSDDEKYTAGGDTDPSFASDQGDELLVDRVEATPGTLPGGSVASLDADKAAEEPEKIVKICKTCMVSQAGVGEFCTNCGSELVPIRAIRESYMGEVVGGKYKVVDRLGAGGMGEVYLGLNEPLGQRVAIKFLSKKFSADENVIMRFLNEARSYCKVTHPNAVTLLEYGQHDDGALYLITEFIEGKSLSDTLREIGPLDLELLVSVSTQICEVLSAAHAQGVIHRDLKPDNIMLMPTSRGGYAVKVLDFGIAKIIDDEHAHASMTETGSVFGTPEFMSPEQACGDPIDARSDLYAAGIILFYLATGKLPFKGKNKLVVLHKQLHESPPRPTQIREDLGISEHLEDIILRCLRKDPAQRYQSADELLSALESLTQPGAPTATQLPNTPARPYIPAARRAEETLDESSDPEFFDSATRQLASGDPEFEAVFSGVAHDEDEEFSDSGFHGGAEFSDGFEAGTSDFSLDISDDLRENESWQLEPAPGRGRLLAAGAAVILLFGAGGYWLLAGSGDPAADDASIDIGQILTTGQVLGSLSAAEESVRHGDFDSALRAIEATYAWVDAEALAEDASERRERLRADIGKLAEIDERLSAAIDAGDCALARRTLRTMGDIDAAAEKTRADALAKCKEDAPSAPKSKPTPTAAAGAAAGPTGGRAQESEAEERAEPPAEAEAAAPSTGAPEESEDTPPSQADDEAQEPDAPRAQDSSDEPPKPPAEAAEDAPTPPEDEGEDEEPVEEVPALPGDEALGDDEGASDEPAREESAEDDAADEEAADEGEEKPESEDPGFALPPKTLD